MPEALLVLSMLAHAGLSFGLYAALTWARWRAVNSGTQPYAAYELGDGEDRLAARISANLRNQFEAPVLFHVGALLLLQLDAVGTAAAAAGLVFVAGRVLHALVQTLSGDVRLRGLVFTINFLAVVALWGLIALEMLLKFAP